MNSIKTIIFVQGGGRFANQLLNYAHLLAFIFEGSQEHEIINIPFWDYESLFKHLNTHSFEHLEPLRYSFLIKILYFFQSKMKGKIYKYIRYITAIILSFIAHLSNLSESIIVGEERSIRRFSGIRNKDLSLDGDSFKTIVNKNQVILLAGWGIRSWKYLEKHQLEVKNYLRFNDSIYQEGQDQIDQLRQKYDFLIGVHIRQGDYQYYKDGLYLFDSERYLDWIKEAKQLYSKKGNVGILVTSDTIQDQELFNFDYIEFSRGSRSFGHFSVSICQLSLCDLIIGPPSTFSLWSAFLGNCPLLVLSSPDQKLSSTQIMYKNFFDAIQHKDLFSI